MVTKYKKGESKQLSYHFKSTHFDCQCKYQECTETLIDNDLIFGLEELWDYSGGFNIDSGYRCPKHNADVKGVTDSQHCLGTAADCKSLVHYKGNLMSQYANEVQVFKDGGIGIYPTFVHVDVRKERARWGTPKTC